MVLRVLIVDDSLGRAADVAGMLVEAGYEVSAALGVSSDWYTAVRRIQPDVIIIDIESLDRDTLVHLRSIQRDEPRPIVMFCGDDADETICTAVKAGVSAYVVDGLYPRRVKHILQAAVARFQEFQKLKLELAKVQSTLAERKVLERAKGILMKQRGLSEEEAYQTLRKLAMNRNKRIFDVAEGVIVAVELS